MARRDFSLRRVASGVVLAEAAGADSGAAMGRIYQVDKTERLAGVRRMRDGTSRFLKAAYGRSPR
ncbi:hypothetical protein GCM10027072_53650 [Streptomyces bullii]